jgi:hypothetical protein
MLPFVASTVTAKVIMGTSQAINMKALDKDGNTIDQVFTPAESGKIHTLAINKAGIVSVVLSGGGGEGLLIELCIEGEAAGGTKEATPPGKENIVTNVALVAQPQAAVREPKTQPTATASKTRTTETKSPATRTAPKAKAVLFFLG